MPRINSTTWSVNDAITAARLQNFNQDIDDIYTLGTDRGRIRTAASLTALRIDIAAFAWRVGSTSGQYAGGVDIVVTNTATNYVEIDATGTIVINTSGWVTANGRLGTVTCSGGVVTAISIWKVDVIGGTLGTSTLVNVSSMSGNVTIASTDKYYQYLNPNGANRTVTLDTTNMSEGNTFFVKNTGTANVLKVLQSTTVLTILAPGMDAIFAYDGSTWRPILDPAWDDYGTGADGDVTIGSNTTLAADKNYNNLTISSGFTLTTAGYIVKVKNTTTFADNTAFIVWNGNAGGNGSNGVTNTSTQAAGGSAGAALTGTSLPGSKVGIVGGTGGTGGDVGNPAGVGAPGGAGTAETVGIGTTGAVGTQGGAGGNGGAAGGPVGAGGTCTCQLSTLMAHIMRAPIISGTTTLNGNGGGASGSGGGGGKATSGTGGGGGGGGGSGSNGGNIWFSSRIITGAGAIKALGGGGGTGGQGGDSNTGGQGRGGGGAGGSGGSGGVVVVVYEDISGWTGSQVVVTGGAGGPGGPGGTGTGAGGSAGATGTTGTAGVSFLIYRPYMM